MTKEKVIRSLIGIALPFALTGAAFAQATTTKPTDGTMANDPAPSTDTMPANPSPSDSMDQPSTSMPAQNGGTMPMQQPDSTMPMPQSGTPMQQNMAMPGSNGAAPMPATKTYPPCSRTLQDSCTNTRREANTRRPHRR